MSNDLCLFCNVPEPNYKPQAKIDFICSQCVQMLIGADQEDLKKAHTKAIDKGYPNKASAIESFLIPEGLYGQRKPATKNRGRHINRKRIVRVIGDKKKRIGRTAIPAEVPVL